MHYDKEKAKSGKWRVPEKRLWLIAILGGAPGMLIGMFHFRHKTKHPRFQIGLPILTLLYVFFFSHYYIS
ncbi:hypothetical protein A374_15504 [Fictibacillus macauensis ZFHKF-1]|uniref:DUF1294 domain-containing protein n=2 Tax=Fictibacillus TaxID=1329200 RepID=I8UCA9_9BACL|nr:hypothetical protein A374_15504 [Fictibacillus macauensis ZFHKF-1]